MTLSTLFPHQVSYTPTLPNRQGRSKKVLRPVIEYVGGFYVARFEGRPSRFFGATAKEAFNNLRSGQ